MHSHLISDHYHYWEDGGATYHTRYSSFAFIRGQESDPWKVLLTTPIERIREKYHPSQNDPNSKQNPYNYMINREFIKEHEDFPSVQCFKDSYDFLDINRAADNWLLQVETFDPHEPFFAPEKFREKFKTNYAGPILDWPRYERVTEPADEVSELRANYFALLSLCDFLLGEFLDYFDAHQMWDDTALIVTTDHGFLLGEHDWWAKNRMPLYEEISHIPLFIHHPDHKDKAGERRKSLTQTIDLMPTFCELFGAEVPREVQGQSLLPFLERDQSSRTAGIFGYWGGGINVVDGRYTYFCYPKDMKNQDLYQYTLDADAHDQDVHGRGVEERQPGAALRFHQGRLALAHRAPVQGRQQDPLPSISRRRWRTPTRCSTTWRAIRGRPGPVTNRAVIDRLNGELFRLMAELDAPPETVKRMRESLSV